MWFINYCVGLNCTVFENLFNFQVFRLCPFFLFESLMIAVGRTLLSNKICGKKWERKKYADFNNRFSYTVKLFLNSPQKEIWIYLTNACWERHKDKHFLFVKILKNWKKFILYVLREENRLAKKKNIFFFLTRVLRMFYLVCRIHRI